MLLVAMEPAGASWIDVVLVEKPDEGFGAVGDIVRIAANREASNTGESHGGSEEQRKKKQGPAKE